MLRAQVISQLPKGKEEWSQVLTQLLEMQRQRISNLEEEYDSLYIKYDAMMNDRMFKERSAEKVIERKLLEEQSDIKTKVKEEEMKELTKNYAKEISDLKAQRTAQGA